MPGIEAKSDEEYEAEWDAKTLSTAKLIRDDEQRFTRAQRAAVRLAKEKKDEADAMKTVAGKEWHGGYPEVKD